MAIDELKIDEEWAGERLRTEAESPTDLVCRLWRKDWFPWFPARYVLAVMSFLGFVNVYALRVNLSMALVVMVNNTEDAFLNNVSIEQYLYILVYIYYI